GAFVPNVEKAQELAQVMVDIGKDAGRKIVALLSDMNQPLGHAIGNALEVKEAIAALQGDGPAGFWAHCLEVGGHMLRLAGKADSLDAGKAMITAVRDNGSAFAKFRDMVAAQGGDVAQVDNPDLLPSAQFIEQVVAPRSGWIAAMDTTAIGWANVRLGAGRLVKSDKIDHAVGMILPTKVGEQLEAGHILGEIHANDFEKLATAREELLAAITWSDEPVEPLPHFYGTVA
ncbi:MAG: pyrimidine-nucleoside phosphorylase, partial [Chloroflexi bacterium]